MLYLEGLPIRAPGRACCVQIQKMLNIVKVVDYIGLGSIVLSYDIENSSRVANREPSVGGRAPLVTRSGGEISKNYKSIKRPN